MLDLVTAGDIADLSELQPLEAADGRHHAPVPSCRLSSRIRLGSCMG